MVRERLLLILCAGLCLIGPSLAAAQTIDPYDRPDDAKTARAHRQQIAWLEGDVGALSRLHHLDQRTLWAIADALSLATPNQRPDQLLEAVRKAADDAEKTRVEFAALKAKFEALSDKSLGAYAATLLAKAQEAFDAGQLDEVGSALAELAPIDESRARVAEADWVEIVEQQAGILNLEGRYDEASALQLHALDAKLERDREENFWLASGAAYALEQKGQLRGDNEALGVAISLYVDRVLPLAPRVAAASDWAATQMNLGAALGTLGERESGTEDLQKAVAALTAALEVNTRQRVPSGWAEAQMDLGGALSRLGERESGTEDLQKAVAAYAAALEEFTRERTPLDWAITQMDLGSTLSMLGERENRTEDLQKAVAAFTAALEVNTRQRVPLEWAGTQMSLGSTLSILGERENGTEDLQSSVAAYTAALEEFTRHRVPLDWAKTQVGLGSTLTILGLREKRMVDLQKAVAAYTAALEENTRQRVPLEWAKTQVALGNTLAILGELENGTENLQKAVIAHTAALEEFTRPSAPLEWAQIQLWLSDTRCNIAERQKNKSNLDLIERDAENARTVAAQAHDSALIALAHNVLSEIAQARVNLKGVH